MVNNNQGTGGSGDKTSHFGRPPMTHAFHDKIIRQERARRSWERTFGDMESIPKRRDMSSTGLYFTTTFPVVSSALIGHTSWVDKKRSRRTPDSKTWAARHVGSSEAQKDFDTSWTKDTGTRVSPTRAVPPPRGSLWLGKTDTSLLSITGEGITAPSKTRVSNAYDCYPRGTRASTYHEKVVAPDEPKDNELKDTVEIMKAVGKDHKSRPGPSGSFASSPTELSVPRPTNEHPESSLHQPAPTVRTAQRTDPVAGYAAMLWAATGRDPPSGLPDVPRPSGGQESQGRIRDEYTGWVAGRGDVTFARSEVQILDGLTKHRRKASGFIR